MLLPLDDALGRALAVVTPGPTRRAGPDALGLFLAEDVTADRALPSCDNSAMDGYAVRAGETSGATRDRPARLRVVGTVYAGAAPAIPVGPGEAVRIFTGAPVPEGADAVIRQEATKQEGTDVLVFKDAPPGANIRRHGEEIAQGQRVFRRGQRVDPYVLALLASLGREGVRVYEPVTVAILSVGDELLPLGAPALPHQLYESNSLLVTGLARACNGVVVTARRSADDLSALKRELASCAEQAQFVVTCGGASVGDKDLVKRALRELGAELVVDGVALKPGKPVGVARLGERVVVVLPGNPGAAAVGFDQLARPLLLARQGAREIRRRLPVRLDSPQSKRAGLTYFLSARLEVRGGELWARVRPQGAGQLLQNVASDGWVELPRGKADFAAGETVNLESVHGSAYVALDAPEEHGARGLAPAVAVVGWSNSGKTTLASALVCELTGRGLKVAVMKHSSHDHPLHKPGSDTERLADAGAAQTVLVTPQGAQWVTPEDAGAALERLRASRVDLVIVEGWKEGPVPKVEVRGGGTQPLDVDEVALVVSDPAAEDVAQLADRVLSIAREGKG